MPQPQTEVDYSGFNFLDEPVKEQGKKLVTPEVMEPQLDKYTPRQFAQDILDVANEGGRKAFLRAYKLADPKGYADLLKRIIPRNLQLDGIEGIHVTLINKFGETLEIDASGGTPRAAPNAAGGNGSGQPIQIATSGTPIEIDIKDKAEDIR